MHLFLSPLKPEDQNIEELAGMACAGSILNYLKHKKLFLTAIMYEELIANPTEKTGQLFEILGIPQNLVALGVTAFAKDSQGKFFGQTDGRESDAISAEKWQKMDNIFEQIKVPLVHDMPSEEFAKLFA
jgi:hypothetical protein